MALNYNWRGGKGTRGVNQIVADPQRLESADGKRWATGRNVKRALPDHCFDGVEVWTLKYRDEDTKKVVVFDSLRDRTTAQAWVNGTLEYRGAK